MTQNKWMNLLNMKQMQNEIYFMLKYIKFGKISEENILNWFYYKWHKMNEFDKCEANAKWNILF